MMKKFVLLLLLSAFFALAISGISYPSLAQEQCGVERWSIKTGTDADATHVDITTSTPTTIADLIAIPAPAALPNRRRLTPVETTVYVIDATLVGYKLETDSDYHLVISDDQGNTMIVEIPSPNCVGDNSPFKDAISSARASFEAQYKGSNRFQHVSIPVEITGVGFFDFLHGQTGVAPNGIELHPVLDILFNPEPQVVGQTYYVKTASARVRSEPKTNATLIATLSRGTAITVLEVVEGATVSGSTTWYKVSVNGKEGYVHSSLLSDQKPPVIMPTHTTTVHPTATPGGQLISTPAPTTLPVSTIPPVSSGGGGTSCPSLSATCSQLTCDQAYACLRAGNGRLDRDHDGVPCESVCPGG